LLLLYGKYGVKMIDYTVLKIKNEGNCQSLCEAKGRHTPYTTVSNSGAYSIVITPTQFAPYFINFAKKEESDVKEILPYRSMVDFT